jgi:hypothetical protein
MAIPGKGSYHDAESEYGGRGGIIQSAADGHDRMSASEARMVHRIWGSRTAGLMPDLPETDLHYQNVQEELTSLPLRTNDRRPEEQPTETVATSFPPGTAARARNGSADVD